MLEIKNKILEKVKMTGMWYETFEHEEVLTSEQAAATRHGYSLHQGAKAMIMKTEENIFAMLVIPGDFKVDSKKAKIALQTKSFRFANVEELGSVTGGVLPGAVPPFGSLFEIKTYVDRLVFENEKIVFNAGMRTFSLAIKSADYKQLEKVEIADLV